MSRKVLLLVTEQIVWAKRFRSIINAYYMFKALLLQIQPLWKKMTWEVWSQELKNFKKTQMHCIISLLSLLAKEYHILRDIISCYQSIRPIHSLTKGNINHEKIILFCILTTKLAWYFFIYSKKYNVGGYTHTQNNINSSSWHLVSATYSKSAFIRYLLI